MRKFGHVRHRRSEAIVLTCYVIYFGYIMRTHFQWPLNRFLLVTMEYQCGDIEKYTILAFIIWARLVMPLAPQVLFICLVWQSSRIQSEAQRSKDNDLRYDSFTSDNISVVSLNHSKSLNNAD